LLSFQYGKQHCEEVHGPLNPGPVVCEAQWGAQTVEAQ